MREVKKDRKEEGEKAERMAEAFLTARGLIKLAANYRCRLGEIDLIMRDGTCLVFVEVRARSSAEYGGASASVTYGKQQKIINTARYFLMMKNLQDKCPVRFDVVSLDGEPPRLHWIRDAFTVSG